MVYTELYLAFLKVLTNVVATTTLSKRRCHLTGMFAAVHVQVVVCSEPEQTEASSLAALSFTDDKAAFLRLTRDGRRRQAKLLAHELCSAKHKVEAD